MADVEMDLDPSRNITHGDPIDEDLIEYDLDTEITDGKNATEWTAEDLDIQDAEGHDGEATDTHGQMEAMVDVPADLPSDAMETFDPLPFSGTTVNDADMLSDLGQGENLDDEILNTVHLLGTNENDEINAKATDLGLPASDAHLVEQEGLGVAESADQIEEIDFGTAPEGGEIVAATSDTHDAASAQPALSTSVDAAETTSRAAEDATEGMDQPAAQTQREEEEEEEEELTWEEDGEGEEAVTTTSVHDDTAAVRDDQEPSKEIEAAVDDVEGEARQVGERERIETQDVPDVHENGIESTAPQHEDEAIPGETHEEHVDLAAQQQVPAEEASAETSYPSITVQYKGEEFPCFAPSDGFFTNPAMLKESIQSLLAGFRAELASELAQDEELVFHVDELGLEFAESTQGDLLSGTTLQYLLEIYDMLAHNQDQDHHTGARNLYTYLFTRSSTQKRLDHLTESAASGKGLDEVIHLFEPAMTHHHVGASLDETPAILNEEGDDYPSPGDDQLAAEDVDYDEAEILQEETEHAVADASLNEDEFDHPAGSTAEAEQDAHEDTADNAVASDPAIASGEDAEDAANEAVDNGALHETEHDGDDNAEAGAIEVPEEEADDFDAFDVSNTQLDQPGQDDDSQEIEGLATATSTSSTVDGNEIPTASHTEGTVEGRSGDLSQAGPDGAEDDLGEIDWREEGDEEEETSGAGDDTTQAKRARADDAEAVDEENDAKRQRSS